MGNLYSGESFTAVVLVTLILGGGAAWLSGRAVANAWQPIRQVVITAILLGAAARFIHFALFGGTLLSATSYICDTLIFLIVGVLAWRATRAALTVRQYPWLYVRHGPFSWREIGEETAP